MLDSCFKSLFVMKNLVGCESVAQVTYEYGCKVV